MTAPVTRPPPPSALRPAAPALLIVVILVAAGPTVAGRRRHRRCRRLLLVGAPVSRPPTAKRLGMPLLWGAAERAHRRGMGSPADEPAVYVAPAAPAMMPIPMLRDATGVGGARQAAAQRAPEGPHGPCGENHSPPRVRCEVALDGGGRRHRPISLARQEAAGRGAWVLAAVNAELACDGWLACARCRRRGAYARGAVGIWLTAAERLLMSCGRD